MDRLDERGMNIRKEGFRQHSVDAGGAGVIPLSFIFFVPLPSSLLIPAVTSLNNRIKQKQTEIYEREREKKQQH